VQACSSYIKSCDEFSSEVEGRTIDGISSPPQNPILNCHYDQNSHETFVSITWEEPNDPQGFIIEYEVVLSGNASYYDEHGRQTEDRIVPITKNVPGRTVRKAEFPSQPPNTRIFVK
jgi:hypothetical protein